MFKDCGIAHSKLVRDRETDKFRGFGYVEFNDKEGYDKALQRDGTTLFDREVRISPAERKGGNNRQNNQRGNGSGSGNTRSYQSGGFQQKSFGNSSYGRDREPRERQQNEFPTEAPFTAFVGNFDYNATEDDLKHLFEGLNITEVRIAKDRATDRSRGHGYIDFGDADSLRNALTIDDKEWNGRALRVDVANEKKTPFSRGGASGGSGFNNNSSRYGNSPADSGPWRRSAGGELNKKKLPTPSLKATPQAETGSKEDPFGGAAPRQVKSPEKEKPVEAETK